jgi:hypothetical protein
MVDWGQRREMRAAADHKPVVSVIGRKPAIVA